MKIRQKKDELLNTIAIENIFSKNFLHYISKTKSVSKSELQIHHVLFEKLQYTTFHQNRKRLSR